MRCVELRGEYCFSKLENEYPEVIGRDFFTPSIEVVIGLMFTNNQLFCRVKKLAANFGQNQKTVCES